MAAEVVAVASSVAAILQLVDYSKRFLSFLNEYQAKTANLPLSFQLILSQRHLLIRSLEILEARAQQNDIDDDMIPYFQLLSDACYKEMKNLDSVLKKFATSGTSSRAKKAIKAIRHEKEIRQSAATLKECFTTLFMAYQINAVPLNQTPSTVVNSDSSESESLVTLDEPTQEVQTALLLTTGKEHHKLPQTTLVTNRCNCKHREFVQSSTSWSLGSTSVSSEILTLHRSGCPFHARCAKQHRLAFNLQYTSVMLNIIARVSMSMKHGAGGISLSPNLSLRGMRREDSPAFRLFDQVEWLDCRTAEDAMAKMNQVSLRLRQIFDEGIASPFDLDRNGNSLIWVCTLC